MQPIEAVTVGILADDLTSAADGAAPFVNRGLHAAIGRGRLPRKQVEVAAVDGGMRSLAADQAGARAAALTAQLASQHILYKTVDSTLRGHVRIEIEAAFRASRRTTLVFAPAFPASGRTTVGGIQFVDGIPVAETLYGRDPVHPARHSALADLVPAELDRAIFLDAETQDELDHSIAAIPHPETVLWVGSPGMAHALARLIVQRPAPAAFDSITHDILVVIGTANPRSHGQATNAEDMPGITVLRSPLHREADPGALLARIADSAAARVRRGGVAALIATGGDTMEAILSRLAIDEFEILRELEPGFPLGRACGADGRPLLIAMKAGGFGDAGTLRRAVSLLRQPSASSIQERA